tara:strand:+ start:119 stop:250 length:132 start_codon:yes stop_codon:yes gene_type:complete
MKHVVALVVGAHQALIVVAAKEESAVTVVQDVTKKTQVSWSGL